MPPRRTWYKRLSQPYTNTITRPATVPVEAYTVRQTGVPLTGGQALGPVPASGAITLQIGPEGLGTVWYPAQVTTSTTSGVNDTSTCLVYMGAAGTPTTLMGTLYPGGAGVLAVAFPPLTVGLFIIAIFSGAKQGDIAAVNVTGSMDYLDTP